MKEAGLVLCGGRSRRMERDKSRLPFGEETLLERTARIVGEEVEEVWAVAREGQEVDVALPVARDPAEGLGPLAGLVAGLEATKADAVFLTSCDTPLLRPALVRFLLKSLHGFDAAVPRVQGYFMTTVAAYSASVLPRARELLAQRRLRPLYLVESVNARILEEEEIRALDPDFSSFVNCNTKEDYEEALRRAGLR